jgi:hypothetical protein
MGIGMLRKDSTGIPLFSGVCHGTLDVSNIELWFCTKSDAANSALHQPMELSR